MNVAHSYSHQARASTIKGVSGKQMSQQHSCRVDFERSLMLMDALPRRSTNFFTGSERCARHGNYVQLYH